MDNVCNLVARHYCAQCSNMLFLVLSFPHFVVNSHFLNSHFFNSHLVNSHFVNVDIVGIDKVGIDKVGSWQSGKLMKWEGLPFYMLCASVKSNVKTWQNCMVPLGVTKQLSIISNTRTDWLQGRVDSNGPWRLPSSGHWAKLMIKTALFPLQQLAISRSSTKPKSSVLIELSLSALQSTHCV